MTEPLVNTKILERLHVIAEKDESLECTDVSCENCALYISHVNECLIALTCNLYDEVKCRNDRRERK